jgi:hypothetical protein
MKILSIFVVLITAAACAEDLPTSGVLKSAGVFIGRSNNKFSAGPLGGIESTQDFFSAAFSSIDYSKIARTDPPPVANIGPCQVQSIAPLADPQPDNTSAITYVDAGPVINLKGPNGNKQFPATRFLYSGQLGGGAPIPGLPTPPPLYLDPGTYTVDNGAGGADIGPFTATLTLPAPFVWSNTDAATSIDRAAGIDVRWTGGDPEALVYIGGSVALTDAAARRIGGGSFFACAANGSAGHFFVPAEVLTLLPASTTVQGVSNGLLSVTTGVQTKFDLLGIDQSTFSFTLNISRSAEYK